MDIDCLNTYLETSPTVLNSIYLKAISLKADYPRMLQDIILLNTATENK